MRVWFWFCGGSASRSCCYAKTWLQAARDRNHRSSRSEPQTTEDENLQVSAGTRDQKSPQTQSSSVLCWLMEGIWPTEPGHVWGDGTFREPRRRSEEAQKKTCRRNTATANMDESRDAKHTSNQQEPRQNHHSIDNHVINHNRGSNG